MSRKSSSFPALSRVSVETCQASELPPQPPTGGSPVRHESPGDVRPEHEEAGHAYVVEGVIARPWRELLCRWDACNIVNRVGDKPVGLRRPAGHVGVLCGVLRAGAVHVYLCNTALGDFYGVFVSVPRRPSVAARGVGRPPTDTYVPFQFVSVFFRRHGRVRAYLRRPWRCR